MKVYERGEVAFKVRDGSRYGKERKRIYGRMDTEEREIKYVAPDFEISKVSDRDVLLASASGNDTDNVGADIFGWEAWER